MWQARDKKEFKFGNVDCFPRLWRCFVVLLSAVVLPLVYVSAAVDVLPTVVMTEPNASTIWPTNFTLRISAEAADADGQVKRVEFYTVDNGTRPATTNKIAESVSEPYSLIVTLRATTVSLFAVATDNAGLITTSAPVRLRFLVKQQGSLGHTPFDPINPVTAHYERELTFDNLSTFVLEGARLNLFDVPPGMRIVNASGTLGNAAYLEYTNTMLPGNRTTFLIEIERTNTAEYQDTRYLIEPIPVQPKFNLSGQAAAISGFGLLTNGFSIEWEAPAGSSYAVQYSDDLAEWETTVPVLTGFGTPLQWIDNGPPKTSSPPMSEPHRFYRVLRLNP